MSSSMRSPPLPERFRRHADALARDGRSPLSAQLMYAAAADIESGGLVAQLFEGVPTPPRSVPQLRLLAALHHLVLAGKAPRLADFYPSVGGLRPPEEVWPMARAELERHRDWIAPRLHITVQTNEPGRSAVLFAGLLWLAEHHRRPIRLLEIGASAGLNLSPERYCYVSSGAVLGEPASPVRFVEPWQPGPGLDLAAAWRQLTITARQGCDRRPLDPRDPADRIVLLSYIWPDEPDRIERTRAALDLAAAAPVTVTEQPASAWLPGALAEAGSDELVVIWQSVVRQYVEAPEWQAIEASVATAADAAPGWRLAWLSMEPGEDLLAGMRVTLRHHPGQPEQLLATCGDHGPPVRWIQSADA